VLGRKEKIQEHGPPFSYESKSQTSSTCGTPVSFHSDALFWQPGQASLLELLQLGPAQVSLRQRPSMSWYILYLWGKNGRQNTAASKIEINPVAVQQGLNQIPKQGPPECMNRKSSHSNLFIVTFSEIRNCHTFKLCDREDVRTPGGKVQEV